MTAPPSRLKHPKHQQVIEAVRAGLKYRDVSEVLDVPLGTVGNIVSSAQKRGELPKRYDGRHKSRERKVRLSGSIMHLRTAAGLDALRWLCRAAPAGMTAYEFIGVLIRDAYQEETEK